jgi:hypothetical protein
MLGLGAESTVVARESGNPSELQPPEIMKEPIRPLLDCQCIYRQRGLALGN